MSIVVRIGTEDEIKPDDIKRVDPITGKSYTIHIREKDEQEKPGIVCKTPQEALSTARIINELTKEQVVLMEKYPVLAEILNNPKLSKYQRKLASLPYLRKMKDELNTTGKGEKVSEEDTTNLNNDPLGVVGKLQAIFKNTLAKFIYSKELKLEKNECSRLHKLIDFAIKYKVVVGLDETVQQKSRVSVDFGDFQIFVVQHDWAQAFDKAVNYDEGQFTLPYPRCVFEFKVNGFPCLVMAHQEPAQEHCEDILVHLFVCADDCWFADKDPIPINEPKKYAFYDFLCKEIRAICISLDACVAEHNIIRAPHKLNEKRIKNDKVPLYDYHLVSLANRNRTRTAGIIIGGASRRGPRLHFRRGHWRHFAESKSWIKWTLVGNPELGFIDKDYAL